MKKQIAVSCCRGKHRRVAVFCLTALLTVTTVCSPAVQAADSGAAATPAPTESSTAANIVTKEQEKQQAETDLKKTEQSKETLEQTKIQLEGYLGELNTKLQELSTNINDLEKKIEAKKQEITTIQANLEVAKKDEKQQYEDMKKRIRFMYEKGSRSLYSALVTGKGFSDILARTEYIAQISKYDREMLDKYQATKDKIADNETALEAEQKNLTAMEDDLKKQQQDLEKTVAQTKDNIQKHEAEIAQAELQIQGYEKEIAEKEAQINDLRSIQEAEAVANNSQEVAAAAQQAQNIANGLTDKLNELGITVTQSVTPTYGEAYAATATDLVLMATIIFVEAGVEPFEGKCAVGACVMNRVRSPQFPNTILGVIYDPGQFTPVTTGRFALALAQGVPDECYRAAQMALNGYNNIGDYLYFRTPNGRVSGLQIGGHIFHDGHVF